MENDQDTGLVLLCAVRYAIGRRTYIPRVVTEWAQRYWDYIKPKDRRLILTEIEEYIESGRSLGDYCDVETWVNFKNWIKEQETNYRPATLEEINDAPMAIDSKSKTFRGVSIE